MGKDLFDGVHLYSIIQDDTDNSIWLTSNKGIYHYDGIKFTHQLPSSSKNTSFFNLIKDINGSIYCNNLNGQVFKLKNKQFQLYYTIPKPYSGNINEMQFDNLNNLNLNLNLRDQLIINEKKEITETFPYSNGVVKNKDTIYYVRHIDNQPLMIKKVDSLRIKTKVKANGELKMMVINNRVYGLKLQTQLYKLKRNVFEEVSLPFLKREPFHLSKSKHHLWLGSYKKGVFCIAQNEIEINSKPQKWFKNTFISGAFTDNENNTWLLTFGKGIIIIPNIENTIATAPNGFDFQGISKTDNQLYISTQNGQIFNINNGKLIPYFKTDNDDRVEFIKIYPKKGIVVTNMKVYTPNYKHKAGFCRDAVLEKDSLVLALSSGLFKKSTTNKNRRNGKVRYKGRVYSIYQDTITQKIWFSTTNGLKQYKNGIFTSLTYNGKEIIEANIKPVNNQIWVTSKDGILIYENDSITQHLTQKDGLLSNDIENIKYEHPNVYLAYHKGMQRYNTKTKTFSNFTFADGLTKSTTKFEVLNNTVYGINSDGLLRFTFNKENAKQNTYKTQITKATANGNNQITNGSNLSADAKNLNFSFLTPTFKHQKEIRYEYQLIGLDKQPIATNENQFSVNYANVPAGNYTFKVDSFLRTTKNESAILNFSIAEYWYKTKWFQLGLITLILLILYYIYRTRVNSILRKRDKEAIQKRLAESSLTSLKAQMNPHFLFNAINSIQSLVLHKQQNEAYSYLTQLANLIRSNLYMSNESFVTLAEELNLIEQYLELEKLRFEDTFNYSIENSINDMQYKIPSMIIQPFIENAVKHGLLHKETNRKLSIIFSKENNIIICEVIDNGIGRKASEEINKRKRHKSFATEAIKKRFEILKTYYTLDLGYTYHDLYDENNQPAGTKVTIRILINEDE